MNFIERMRSHADGMSAKGRQWLLLGSIVGAIFLVMYLALVLGGDGQPTAKATEAAKARFKAKDMIKVAGEVTPVDEWVAGAGRRLAQFEVDRKQQQKHNEDQKTSEKELQKKVSDLEEKVREAMLAVNTATAARGRAPTGAVPEQTGVSNGLPAGMPPGAPPGSEGYALAAKGFSGATPGRLPQTPPPLGRVELREAVVDVAGQKPAKSASSLPKYLPVSFARGVLLGGIDAPTGGQAQSNPLPVLIRLTDNAVLPNRFRATVKECFVVASGFGDIGSERAYMRTSSLSCVRRDGGTLELDIKGNIYGEDGKLGLRGRLVTKQGQMLANALRAGVVGGIGQGFSQSGVTYGATALGGVASQGGGPLDAVGRGLGTGVGRAMDNLANYYIKLAEQTFPVIEIDAGRQVDVVITKGVTLGNALDANDGDAEDDDGELTAGGGGP